MELGVEALHAKLVTGKTAKGSCGVLILDKWFQQIGEFLCFLLSRLIVVYVEWEWCAWSWQRLLCQGVKVQVYLWIQACLIQDWFKPKVSKAKHSMGIVSLQMGLLLWSIGRSEVFGHDAKQQISVQRSVLFCICYRCETEYRAEICLDGRCVSNSCIRSYA